MSPSVPCRLNFFQLASMEAPLGWLHGAKGMYVTVAARASQLLWAIARKESGAIIQGSSPGHLL